MGISKILGGLFGGNVPKPAPAPVIEKPAPVESEDEKRKKSLVAINQGEDSTGTLGVTTPAKVTKRYLLGL